MISRSTILLALLFVAGTTACGDDEGGTGGGGGGGGGGGATVTVSDGLAPDYNWNGGLADSIYVVRTSAPTVKVWGLRATTAPDGFGPIITHGTTPSGTQPIIATEATLTAGIVYRVYVARQSGGGGEPRFHPSVST